MVTFGTLAPAALTVNAAALPTGAVGGVPLLAVDLTLLAPLLWAAVGLAAAILVSRARRSHRPPIRIVTVPASELPSAA